MEARRLRPIAGAYRQYTIAGIAAGVGLALSAVVRLRDTPWFAAVLLPALALAALACLPLLARHAGVLLEPGRITRTSMFGLKRRFAPDDVFTVLVVPEYIAPGSLRQSAHTAPNLFLLDAHGAPLLRMSGDFWTPEAMAAVLDAVDVAPLEIAGATRPAALRARFPRALGHRESHPVLAALLLGTLGAAVLVWLTSVFAMAL